MCINLKNHILLSKIHYLEKNFSKILKNLSILNKIKKFFMLQKKNLKIFKLGLF